MQPNAIHEELVRSWGAVPVAVELSEAIRLISGLEVDAQENPLANTVAYGVDRVHPYVTMTGHLYGARGLFAHRASVEALPTDLRRIVEGAARAAIDVQRREAASAEQELRSRMETHGVQFVDLDDEGRTAFLTASRPAIDLARAGVAEDLFELVGP